MPREKGLWASDSTGGIRVAQAVGGKDGAPTAVVTLVLAELHLGWALMSLDKLPGEENIWGMVVGRDGNVLSHPDPSRIASNRPDGAVRVTVGGIR